MTSAEANAATLIVKLVQRRAFRLSPYRADLTAVVTADPDVAAAHLERKRSQSRWLSESVARTLSQISPGQQPGAPPVPARVQTIRRLIDSGLLPASAGDPYLRSGYVPPEAWEQVRKLLALLELPSFESDFWEISLSCSPGQSRLVHQQYPDEFPAKEVLEALNTAIAGGWNVVAIERQFDEDELEKAHGEKLEPYPMTDAIFESEGIGELQHYLAAVRYELRRDDRALAHEEATATTSEPSGSATADSGLGSDASGSST